MSESAPRPFTATEERIAKPLMKYMSLINTWLYRASGGRLGGRWIGGAPVCLVTAIGRKSGQPRTVPLLYLEDGEEIVLVASQGGMSKHPVWYLNMMANPDVDVEVGTATRPMRARRASDEEKAAYWPRLVAMYGDYADYQARTSRDIPVLVLLPR